MKLTTNNTSELLIIFSYRYNYPHETICEVLELDIRIYRHKLQYNEWSDKEVLIIEDYITEIIGQKK